MINDLGVEYLLRPGTARARTGLKVVVQLKAQAGMPIMYIQQLD